MRLWVGWLMKILFLTLILVTVIVLSIYFLFECEDPNTERKLTNLKCQLCKIKSMEPVLNETTGSFTCLSKYWTCPEDTYFDENTGECKCIVDGYIYKQETNSCFTVCELDGEVYSIFEKKCAKC